MASKLGTTLPPKKIAWFWLIVAGGLAAYFTWGAIKGSNSWLISIVFGCGALFVALEPRLRRQERETVQVDESGVLRKDGRIHEQIAWDDITEILIITTNEGPWNEDVFFALSAADGSGCLVPHDAAVRTNLLEELQDRFPTLDDDLVIKAMGSTSNNRFLIWSKKGSEAA